VVFGLAWLSFGCLLGQFYGLWTMHVFSMLLLTPYASFFGLKMNGRFLFLTASAHVIFGFVLGLYWRWKLADRL
jgi:hypothetical protein